MSIVAPPSDPRSRGHRRPERLARGRTTTPIGRAGSGRSKRRARGRRTVALALTAVAVPLVIIITWVTVASGSHSSGDGDSAIAADPMPTTSGAPTPTPSATPSGTPTATATATTTASPGAGASGLPVVTIPVTGMTAGAGGTGAQTNGGGTGGGTGGTGGGTTGGPGTGVAVPVTGPLVAPGGRVVAVASANALVAALAGARAGDTIQLANGTYKGTFDVKTSGTAGAPIRLTGSRAAIVTGTSYGFHLEANYWQLVGFTVADSPKGIVLDGASNNVIDSVAVTRIGDEGIHLRSASSNNVVRNSVISDTGLEAPQFGEGVYLGSAKSNWSKYSGGKPDPSNGNQVLGNTIGPNVRAEGIDVKEGTSGGVISGNAFNGTGIAGKNFADSWVDVKGNNYTISNNTGTNNASASKLLDGYQTHTVVDGDGCGNTFSNNRSDLGGAKGYAINIQVKAGCTNTVAGGNTVANAGSGLTDV